MIWDLHCHLSGVDGKTVDERIAQLMVYADRMKVDRMVFFMGWPWVGDPTPEQFREQNDQVLQAISHWHDRAFGFAYVNGKYPQESIAEINRCIEKGPMVGIKLWTAFKCSDPKIDPIIARCAELKAAVYQHTWTNALGNRPNESTPADMSILAARHPKVPLICGHTGGEWTSGIRAVRKQKNLSIGIGGSEPTAGFVEMAVRELGAHRVIYGSDIGGRSFSSQIAKVAGAEISEADKQLILGKNLKRMLTPILKSKGFQI